MSRLVAVVAVGFGSILLACGGDNPAPIEAGTPDTPTPDTPADAPTDAESGLELDITGRAEPMTARAELKITEGLRPVHVAITGLDSGTDYVMIDLTFDGLENTIGPHHVQFSQPERGEHVAIGSLGNTSYYSQSGDIDISLSSEGGISGNFEILLAPVAFNGTVGTELAGPGDGVTSLVGSFSGDWVLNCHSRLMGHSALVFGGDYCDGLQF